MELVIMVKTIFDFKNYFVLLGIVCFHQSANAADKHAYDFEKELIGHRNSSLAVSAFEDFSDPEEVVSRGNTQATFNMWEAASDASKAFYSGIEAIRKKIANSNHHELVSSDTTKLSKQSSLDEHLFCLEADTYSNTSTCPAIAFNFLHAPTGYNPWQEIIEDILLDKDSDF